MEGNRQVAKKLVTAGKGIFAADASVKSITTRLESFGIAADEENRRKYRELLFTTKGLGEYISGVIMHDESIRQSTGDGRKFRQVLSDWGILVGIKVDGGTTDLAGFGGEKVTEGLDGLRERLAEYKEKGAVFAKWRNVIRIGEGLPTTEAMEVNAVGLAQYAALVQEAGMVSIVEPEVVMEGRHSIDRCAEVTEMIGRRVWESLARLRVDYQAVIYKVNMILPGRDSGYEPSDDEVAGKTVETLNKFIPSECAGVVFLSGGQDSQAATRRLAAIVRHNQTAWPMTFSFERALENKVMETWKGDDQQWHEAQEALLYRARMNAKAVSGKYEGE